MTAATLAAPLIPADVAAAIRAHVLPRSLIDNSSPLEVCPCQYGPCGHCTRGRHGRCTHRNHPPRTGSHTYITTAAGVVAAGPAEVWTVGRPCTWVCPCPTCANPRPTVDPVTAPGNPPARRRSVREALTLLADAPRTAPAPRRRPAAASPRAQVTPEAPTLF